jgi:hypothetical protein
VEPFLDVPVGVFAVTGLLGVAVTGAVVAALFDVFVAVGSGPTVVVTGGLATGVVTVGVVVTGVVIGGIVITGVVVTGVVITGVVTVGVVITGVVIGGIVITGVVTVGVVVTSVVGNGNGTSELTVEAAATQVSAANARTLESRIRGRKRAILDHAPRTSFKTLRCGHPLY